MLVFIDESGDPGLKIEKGSTKFFVIVLVAFDQNEEATACDRAIEKLKRKVSNDNGFEFKFNRLKREKRIKFFEKIIVHKFCYFAVVINKIKLYGKGFKVKESFYKYASSLVFQNAKPFLKCATVVIDGSGSSRFKQQFKNYLKNKVGSGIIKKFKIQSSHSNNLIQLADMIAGAVHRSYSSKDDKNDYRKLISAKEVSIQVWPK